MANRLERVPELTVIPGTPAQPEVPERCVSVQVGTRLVAKQVTEQQLLSPTFSQYTMIDPVGVDGQNVIDFTQVQELYGPLPPGVGDGSTRVYTVYVREPIYEVQCTGGQPFVPGTPSQVIEDAGPDWLSYARSQPVVTASGGFNADLVGPVLVGLMEPVQDGGYSLGVVDYGLYYDGAAVYPVIGGSVGSSLGAYSGTLSVKIERQVGVYKSFIGGTQVHTANLPQTTTAALAAFLETDEGYVENPERFNYTDVAGSGTTDFALTAPAPAVGLGVVATGELGQTGYCGALVDGQLDVLATGVLPLTGETAPNLNTPATVVALLGQTGSVTGTAQGGQIRGTPMTMQASDAPYTSVELTIAKQQLTATSVGNAPNIPLTRTALSPSKPVFSSYMITGGVISSSLSVPKQSLFASEGPFAQIVLDISKQITTGYMTTGETTAVAYSENFAVFNDATPTRIAAINVTLGELDVSGDFVFTLSMTEQLDATLSLASNYSLSRTLQVLVENEVALVASARAPDQVDTQYLVTELTGALSRATGMQFDQFVYSGNRTYGVRSDGLYLIGAEEEVDAEVDFGATTMGTNRAKSFELAYIGMATDGKVYLVANNGKEERVYRAVQRETTMKVKTGRGITGRKWNLKLQVVDATEIELEDLEIIVGASRRWTR